jgi:hypothetical protein
MVADRSFVLVALVELQFMGCGRRAWLSERRCHTSHLAAAHALWTGLIPVILVLISLLKDEVKILGGQAAPRGTPQELGQRGRAHAAVVQR